MTGTATATTRRDLDPARGAAIWMEIELRAIQLTPILRGRLWCASVDVYGERHNKNRAVREVRATNNTALGAVESLLAMLDAEGGGE